MNNSNSNLKFKLLFCCISLICNIDIFGFSGKENNYWVFGQNSAIDFNGGSALAVQNHPLVTYDNTSSICDNSGNLLFYTNGENVWDSRDSIMQNGTGLMGNVTGGQTALIIPVDNKLFYIFTVPEFGTVNGLRYSIVDISLNGFHGEVTVKNILLQTPSTEKLAAYYDKANRRFWLITHEYGNAKFNCYKIDVNGLDPTPVQSTIGSSNAGGFYGGNNGSMGQLSISQDGHHIANALEYNSQVELFDFDSQTGLISNPISLVGFNNAWGLAFSPNGSKLYVTEWTYSNVYQLDLSVYNQSSIQSSVYNIGVATGTGVYHAGYMQLAPDGKIYIARYGVHYLATISSPDLLASLCVFMGNGFNLGAGTSRAGLSTCLVFSDAFTEISELTSVEVSNIVFPNPSNDEFKIKIINEMKKELKVYFYNEEGKSTEFPFHLEQSNLVVNTQGIKSGNYYFLLNDDRVYSRGRFIVQ